MIRQTTRDLGQQRAVHSWATNLVGNDFSPHREDTGTPRWRRTNVSSPCLPGPCLFFVPVRHPTPELLPGKSHGWRSLECCGPRGHWGLDTTQRLHFHFSLSCIEEGNGNPLQCSCLENPRDGGAWWAAIYGVAQSRKRLKRLSSSSSSSPSTTVLQSARCTLSKCWVFARSEGRRKENSDMKSYASYK